MDHPEVLLEYEKALKRKLSFGVTVDELEEIEEKSYGFGRLIRMAEESENRSVRWVPERLAWVRFKENLPRGVKAEALEAYYIGRYSDRPHFR